MEERTPLLRQPSLYIGLVCGVLLALVAGLVLNSRSAAYRPGTTSGTAGNITLTVDHNAVDLAVQAAVKQVQPQLPITVTGVSTTLRAGDEIDVYLVGQPIFGATPDLLIVLSPTITSSGTLDFYVQRVTLSGLNLSVDSSVNQSIEQSINRQFAAYGRGTLSQGLHYQLVDVSTTPVALILTAQLSNS